MQGTTSETPVGVSPATNTVFDRLATAAYAALGVETMTYAAWMAEAEAAWIVVAGAQR